MKHGRRHSRQHKPASRCFPNSHGDPLVLFRTTDSNSMFNSAVLHKKDCVFFWAPASSLWHSGSPRPPLLTSSKTKYRVVLHAFGERACKKGIRGNIRTTSQGYGKCRTPGGMAGGPTDNHVPCLCINTTPKVLHALFYKQTNGYHIHNAARLHPLTQSQPTWSHPHHRYPSQTLPPTHHP